MTNPTTKTLCELCGQPTDSDSCSHCHSLTTAEIIQTAHNRINEWKQLLTAAAINEGGSLAAMPWQMMEARKCQLIVELMPWNLIVIKAKKP